MTVSADYWKCSICTEILDGQTKGLVVTSKRCFHVFHRVCIEEWIEAKKSCPLCRLSHLTKYEVIPNPEYAVQYGKWENDPHKYTYEGAFQEEYGRSSEEVGIPAEHILRPRELRGLLRREELTAEEISSLYREMVAEVLALGDNATLEQLEEVKKEYQEAENLILSSLEAHNESQHASLDAIQEENKRQFARLDHQMELTRYYEKTEPLIEKIDRKLTSLRVLLTQENIQLIPQFSDVLMSLNAFSGRFRLSGQTHERSIEESQELLKQVDTELDEFLASQPEHIKEILEAPLPPEPAASSSSSVGGIPIFTGDPSSFQLGSSSSSSAAPPVPPPPAPFVPGTENNPPPERPWKGIIGVILGIFALAIGLGYQFRDQLYRRFWNGRLITHQLEM